MIRARPKAEAVHRALLAAALGCVLAPVLASAQLAPCVAEHAHRQSPADAWWTGPMLANSAATLPRGHILIETYVYDVAVRSAFDARGTRRSVPESHGFGTQTYALYGLADRFSVGLIPTAGFNRPSVGPSSSGIRMGDIGGSAQYRLTSTDPCSRMPTMSVNVQETFPTARYDRLGERPSDGMGAGAYTTTVSLYGQKLFWLPTGHILRSRLDMSQSLSSAPRVSGASVYGTTTGFAGRAEPGAALYVDSSWEYSVTRSWVLALDVTYRHSRDSRAVGLDATGADVVLHSGASEAFGLAPAVEYSWASNVGVLFGTRIIAAGRNSARSITPAVAINYVR